MEKLNVYFVISGGITEVGFAFDLSGNLWGVGRNEDGDDSGWGSRIFYADNDQLDNILTTGKISHFDLKNL